MTFASGRRTFSLTGFIYVTFFSIFFRRARRPSASCWCGFLTQRGPLQVQSRPTPNRAGVDFGLTSFAPFTGALPSPLFVCLFVCLLSSGTLQPWKSVIITARLDDFYIINFKVSNISSQCFFCFVLSIHKFPWPLTAQKQQQSGRRLANCWARLTRGLSLMWRIWLS